MINFEALVTQQRQHFYSVVSKKSLWDRKVTLKKLKTWIKNNQAVIIEELQKDFKKSPEDIMISEIKPVIDEIKHAYSQLRFWAETEKKSTPLTLFGSKAKVVKEPKGVCLIIAPWNFPFQLAIGPLVSALAAGNCVAIKPSEMTPHCEKLLQKLVKEVFDPKEVSCVVGGVAETTELLKVKWDHIFFTGSPLVGKIVMKAAAEHLTSVTLELGGKNPVIIDKSANLKDAAKKLIWGKYFNCGQSCVSPNYVFIESSIHDKMVTHLLIEHKKRFGVDGSSDTSFNRIVNAHHYQRVNSLIEDAVEKGALKVTPIPNRAADNYIAPTILTRVNKDSAVFKEEIFGPVLPIVSYSSLDEVIQLINANEKPLALYIFSKSSKNIQQIQQSTSSGAVVINDTTLQFIHPNLPFGGVNNSGIGKAHGKYGFDEFTNLKPIITQRIGFTSAQLIYPPYTNFKRFIIKAITWWV
jgi:aldehyde dehydrogenase (NAD+)